MNYIHCIEKSNLVNCSILVSKSFCLETGFKLRSLYHLPFYWGIHNSIDWMSNAATVSQVYRNRFHTVYLHIKTLKTVIQQLTCSIHTKTCKTHAIDNATISLSLSLLEQRYPYFIVQPTLVLLDEKSVTGYSLSDPFILEISVHHKRNSSLNIFQ